jgi:hypothetical protein
MIFRSRELGIILESQYRELFRQIGMKGWRKAQGEPFDDMVPEVNLSIGKKSLTILESNRVIHAWEIPAELPIPIGVLSEVFQADSQSFVPAEFSNIIPFSSPTTGEGETSEPQPKSSS